MKKKTIIILLILTFAIYASNISVQIIAEENNYRPTSLDLTPHDSISIASDSDFEVFPGTGTAEDPYIIEGYNITTTSFYGISITDTTRYFIIRNCYVDARSSGIAISNVADGTATILNNTCNNNGWGIFLGLSGNSTVSNNTCTNNGCGIFLDFSGSSTVTNNTCSYNYGDGIHLYYSDSSTVTNNTCNNNYYIGIGLWFSGYSTIVNNTCNNNDYIGIELEDSGSSTVTNNTFTNCGLYIDEKTVDAYLSYTVENNWVNGKMLGFYTNLDSTMIDEPVYGQLIFISCSDITVKNQELNNATNGLFLYSCAYSSIIDNTCINNDRGIWLYYSGSSTVINNTCINNNGHGILLSGSGSSTVVNNTCNNSSDGIMFVNSGSSNVAKQHVQQQ